MNKKKKKANKQKKIGKQKTEKKIKPETKQKEEKYFTSDEKSANAHGISNWDKVSRIDFTFNVDRDSSHFERSWKWDPKTNKFLFKRQSNVLDKIVIKKGVTREQLDKEFNLRTKLFLTLYILIFKSFTRERNHMKNGLFFTALISFALISNIAITNTASATLSTDQGNIEQHVEKLNQINFLPNLLPVIINNSDILELSDEQLNKLLTWRNTNKENMIATMNKIVSKRIKIKQAALSPSISAARLIQMQNEIFRLQRQVLNYKSSCRDLVINTFNSTNWEEFFIVLADMEVALTLPETTMPK